jgi:fructose-1,6-bisphosphatase/inositol monophosphatase family enzyme
LIALSQSLWDYAAGMRILEEAGGKISDLAGKAPTVEFPGLKSQDILATNRLLHQWCLDRVGPV